MRRLITLILALTIFIGFATSVRAVNDPAMFVEPPVTNVQVGTNFLVSVRLRDWALGTIDRVYGFQFHLKFDPSVVEVIQVGEGADIVARAPNYFTAVLTYDNSLGTVNVVIVLIPPAPPISESGTGEAILAWVEFHCKSPANTALELQDVMLVNASGGILAGYLIENGFVCQTVFVVPEFWFGPVLGLTGCFAALCVFRLGRRKRS